MKFGYTIIYTDDVEKSIEFFERAFGLKRRFIHESGYGAAPPLRRDRSSVV